MEKDHKLDSENALEESKNKTVKRYRKELALTKRRMKLVLSCVMLIVVIFWTILNAPAHFTKSYQTEKKAADMSAYKQFYDACFDAAEAKAHVSNRISISIEEVKEIAALEVLEASDTEYVISNKEDNADRITSWIEVQGTGVYTVDLSCGEFIVDSRHQYVKARVPRPVLSDFKVDYDKKNQLFFKDDIFDGSVKTGEDLMKNQIQEGAVRLKEYLASNRMIYENAVESAKKLIANLVKQFNPENPDLTVEVEFIDVKI